MLTSRLPPNYHNIVKHTLMYKGIPFEERIAYPHTPELLAANPTGKVPAITTEMASTWPRAACCWTTWEDAYPDTPLCPGEPGRAPGQAADESI